MPAFKNFPDLSKVLNKRINAAVESTAKIAKDVLYQCIDEQYYHDPRFYPNVYKRTKEFLGHAAFQLLSSNSAEIYVDIKGIHYKNNFNTWQVVKWTSESKHGADYYQTNTMDFWTRFIDWCNNELLNVFKSELKKQRINIK